MGQNWDKFRLLLWKNWLLQWRHPIQTTVEVLAPVIFAALLVLIRGLVEPEPMSQRIFSSFTLTDSLTNTSREIAWSPCGNTAINGIMNNIVAELNVNFTIDNCHNDAEALENALWDDTEYILAGVVFSDHLAGKNIIDADLEITLRFPSELRRSGGFMVENWMTNLVFPQYQMPGPRQPNRTQGAVPGYYREGFLTLQYLISRELVKYYTNNDSLEMPPILMQRFPFSAWINDPLQAALQTFVGLLFMLSFVYPCINTVKVITTEKEKQLKESMKIMGLPNWLHWTAWFVKVFVLLVISIILMLILLMVRWFPDSDHSVFTLADPFLLFLFLVLYACATITFCFAISTFFSKANTATTIAGLAWFLSYAIWVFLQDQYATLSLAEKLLICLASNSAMAFGFQLTLMWEGTGEGMIWSNLFSSVSPDDSFTMAHVMLMLIIDTFLYLIVALYVEAVFPGEYGVPKKWYFPFTKSFWCGSNKNAETPELRKLESDVYEKEPQNLNIGIQVSDLTKIYSGNKVAVRNLSFNMFENQITVLLGHNGAGKTTTMSMLTGMITPSRGTALVNGYDIRTSMPKVRNSLGLCPQHNILFDDLTVAEHLYFFSKLKGLDRKEIDQEIDTYIELLQLVPKRNASSKTLSGGMKRKLSVAVAMCGKSKICMLDEPTAGMDPAARRALWDMIVKQKKDRTILLSTHFMDEADLLGDRIAIMAGGKLQCCGSSFFLKKKYGAGYHLIMDKTNKCDVDEVTNLLMKYIPNIAVETNIGSELSYNLAENQSEIFEEMLSDLESNSQSLGINSYGISLTTMEEVFMRVGADHGQEELNNVEDHNGMLLETQTNGSATFSNDSKVNITENEFVTGFALWRNQFMAMLMKKMRVTQRNWILLLVQNIIPIAFMVIALVMARLMNIGSPLPSLTLTLDAFNDPITVITRDTNDQNPYYQSYIDILEREGRNITDWGEESMIENMLERTKAYTSRVRMRYIIGASFDDEIITTWFNNEPFHSPPIALQYSLNAILQKNTDTDHHVQFINYPLPFSTETRLFQMDTGQTVGFQIAFNAAFCMAFVTPFYVLFYVRERVIKSKHLQMVSGVKTSAYWLAAALWDFTTALLTILCLIVTIAAFQERGFSTAEELGRVCVILLIFMIAILPVTYLAAFLFDVPSSGYTTLTLFKVFLGANFFMVVQILGVESLELTHVADGLHWFFSLFPHYSLAYAISRLSSISDMIDICDTISENNWGIPSCMLHEACCFDRNFFNLEDGIGVSLLYMTGVAVLAIALLLLVEYRAFDRAIHSFQNKKTALPTSEDTDDSDVLEEKRKIRAGEIRPGDYDVVLKDLTKQYSNYFAVNQLCLGVKGYECFGLLGINGAGKTTTFKMMTGDEVMSHGDGWIRGLNLKTQMNDVYKNIGYCPQFDALLDDLTGKETLTMYCLLRGIPYRDCSYIAHQLAKDFDFYRHLNKPVKNYSGGNKRKLSSAVALIGDPAVIFLDEPTAGMDPATKRNLWNTLCRIRDGGKCLVLTSHSMEECEALCTRLAIMVNGVFKCLGSTQHLKSKFCEGYMLVVKVRKSASSIAFKDDDVVAIEQYVQSNFPSAVLKESHQELLTYFISDTTLSWSKMFGIMERGKREIDNLEDYSLGQSSLEQVFLIFTKHQRITDDSSSKRN